MRVFVTGGTGLVGSHAIDRLTTGGHEVRALVRSAEGVDFVRALGADPIRGSVEDRASWNAAQRSEAIVHAAALVTTPTTWDVYRNINVEGTRLAAETAAQLGARLVHISSVAVYGRRPGASGTDRVGEDAPFGPIAPVDFYARSKREAEQVLWDVAGTHDLSAVALRPCVIYGERERLFLSRLLGLLRLGVAPVVGSGHNQLAMVYIGNVIDVLMSALDRPDVTGPFNTANDGGLTQLEFYRIVGEETGRRLREVRVPLQAATIAGTAWHWVHRLVRPGRYTGVGSSSGQFMARDNPYTSARANRELDWRPSTPPAQAFSRTVRWFMDHRD
jgi:nucleoside-diphosphate-sugar epimerase